MTYQTIQSRHIGKHLDKISNMTVFSLENGFSGKPVADQAGALAFAIGRLGCKLQVSKTEGKGRIRAHGNLWYEFDYRS